MLCEGMPNDEDNCPETQNPSQANSDSDSHDDASDNFPHVDNEKQADSDGDGQGDSCEECPIVKKLGEHSEKVKLQKDRKLYASIMSGVL